ncbi:MAG: DUF503 domain-containing protein [Dehalococcoidales bacterium]|nr:DUF503 domain-containing protein [Dehalococcoidales bacterium]
MRVLVGVLLIKFRLPENDSLKGKRQVVRSVIARISNNFRVAAAEVDDNDLWQLATIGVSIIGNDKGQINKVLSMIIEFVDAAGFDAEVLDYKMEIVPVVRE